LSNLYLYNAKELQTELELNWLDYGARPYDPTGRLGWLSPDPLAEAYYNISPYAYCVNNPITHIDPSGLWPTKIHNRMITETFSGILSSNDMVILMNASKKADAKEYQDKRLSYRHAMGREDWTREQSEARYNEFINEQFNLYINTQNHKDALTELGMALHAIMDWSAPSHYGFQIWKGFLKEKGFGASHARKEQMKAYLNADNQYLINISKEEMLKLVLKAFSAKGVINLIPEVIIHGSRPQNKSFEKQIQEMLWKSVTPNAHGNTGRYNKPGRIADNLYSDEFLKCWYGSDNK